MSSSGLDRLEEGVARTVELVRVLRAERESLRRENARLLEEVRGLRERLAGAARTAARPEQLQRLRRLERERREVRGRLSEILRLAEALEKE